MNEITWWRICYSSHAVNHTSPFDSCYPMKVRPNMVIQDTGRHNKVYNEILNLNYRFYSWSFFFINVYARIEDWSFFAENWIWCFIQKHIYTDREISNDVSFSMLGFSWLTYITKICYNNDFILLVEFVDTFWDFFIIK